MPWFAAAAPYIAGGLSAPGKMSQAQGTQASAAAEAQANLYNASIERQNAQIAIDQGNVQAGIDAQTAERASGATRAALGASGVDAGSGTSLAVMSDVATQGELQRQLDLYRANLSAVAAQQRAGFDTYAAQTGIQAGQTQSAAQLFTGASRLAGTFAPSF